MSSWNAMMAALQGTALFKSMVLQDVQPQLQSQRQTQFHETRMCLVSCPFVQEFLSPYSGGCHLTQHGPDDRGFVMLPQEQEPLRVVVIDRHTRTIRGLRSAISKIPLAVEVEIRSPEKWNKRKLVCRSPPPFFFFQATV